MKTEIFKTKKNVKESTIALLSDIHYYEGYNHKILNKLYNQLLKSKPDCICITGDILDTTNNQNKDVLYDWLKDISKISPTLIVLGNHDKKSGHMGNWKQKEDKDFINILKKINNLYLLDNENKIFNNMNFYGFNLSYNYYEGTNEKYTVFEEEVKELNPSFKDDEYNIILFHSPINIYKYIKNNPNHPFNKCDLILSGHMHNGCLPFWISNFLNKIFKTTRSIISPLRTFFPKYSQGRVYEIKDGFVYQGVNKLSHSTFFLHYFDFIYRKNIQLITIKKTSK